MVNEANANYSEREPISEVLNLQEAVATLSQEKSKVAI